MAASRFLTGRSNSQQTRATAQEMPGVVIGVETNQVAMQNSQEQLIANGENAVDFATREGSVQEETNLDVLLAVANLLAQHLGEQHKMVIVHPDQVSILDFFGDSFREKPVRFLVGLPGLLVEGDFTGVVVE